MNANRKNRYRPPRGFTAVELMVVLGIIGILAALVVPSLGDMVARTQTRSTAELISTLYIRAQTEAIRRGGNVSIRKGIRGVNPCPQDNDWSCSIDVAFSQQTSPNNFLWHDVINVEIPSGVRVRNASNLNSGPAWRISFDRWGGTSNTNRPAIVIFKPNFPSADRAICIDTTGNLTIIRPTDIQAPCP